MHGPQNTKKYPSQVHLTSGPLMKKLQIKQSGAHILNRNKKYLN